jgi:hypothetical protein
VVTDTVASRIFAIRFACIVVFYWGCSPVIRNCALAIEMTTTVYLFALVCRDYFVDNTDEDMQKSYLKCVSLTYATAYITYIFAQVFTTAVAAGGTVEGATIRRFTNAVFISLMCTYLASPKWRQELFQTVHLRKTMFEFEASRKLRDAVVRRAQTEATIATMTPTWSLGSIAEV